MEERLRRLAQTARSGDENDKDRYISALERSLYGGAQEDTCCEATICCTVWISDYISELSMDGYVPIETLIHNVVESLAPLVNDGLISLIDLPDEHEPPGLPEGSSESVSFSGKIQVSTWHVSDGTQEFFISSDGGRDIASQRGTFIPSPGLIYLFVN
jgi:hypothetical protein